MSEEKSTTVNSGIGVFGLLGCCFVVLKLIGKITWSWWLVTLPFWFGLAIVTFLFLTFFLGCMVLYIRAELRDRKDRSRLRIYP